MTDGPLDVDALAATADRLGLVSPDCQGPDEGDATDEIVALIHIHRGCLVDVGTARADLPRLRVIVVDNDMLEDCDGGEDKGLWVEPATALDTWSRDDGDPLMRARGELPPALARELGLSVDA